MNQQITSTTREELEIWQRYARHLERVNASLRRRLDAAIRKIDADNDMYARMYEELREARRLRKRNEELQRKLDELLAARENA